MSFVIIAEPEEVNAARIRTILDSVDKDFEYELVNSAETAIDVMEVRKADVFIGAMQMSVMSGAELFSLVEMIAPETVRIVMTDGANINETVSFMNECRTYKIIMKPCRVADDLLTPIKAAFSYKMMQEHASMELQKKDEDMCSIKQEYQKIDWAWRENIQNYQQAQSFYVQMLQCNLQLSEYEPRIKERLGRWYQWMMDEYMDQILAGSWDYEGAVRMLTNFCQNLDHGCTFQMKKTPGEIQPECMNVITCLLRLVIGICIDLQTTYQIRVVIETVEKAHILRIRYRTGKDEEGNEDRNTWRVKSEDIRQALIKATKIGINAFGFKIAVLKKEEDDILNIAVPKF